MRVLLVGSGPEERELITKHLVAESFVVDYAADARATFAQLDRDRAEVILVDWALKGVSAADLIKQVRANEKDSHLYIIGLMSAPAPSVLAAAFTTGVDDVMRRPVTKEELVARVGALRRIKQWAGRLLGASAALDWSSGTDFSTRRAWMDADSQISSELMTMLGCPLHPAGKGETMPVFTSAAEIPLSLPADGLEVRLMIAIDAASLKAVGDIVFGGAEVPPEALGDVVREFANTAGGAFKRTASEEGIALTTGLPVDAKVSEFGKSATGLLKEFVVGVEGSPIRIGVRLTVIPRALERVTPNKLREGMVIGRDLHNEGGALLLPSGTRLTEATVARLARALPPTTLIQIAAAA